MRWLTTMMVAFSLLLVPGAAIAGHGNGNGGGHDSFPGLPSEATYGACTAYENNENGRENGQAGQAPPFQYLNETAEENDQTIEAYCAENGQHPGQGHGPDDNPGQGNGTGGPP